MKTQSVPLFASVLAPKVDQDFCAFLSVGTSTNSMSLACEIGTAHDKDSAHDGGVC